MDAAEQLDSGDGGSRGPEIFEAQHGPAPRFSAAMVLFYYVVQILLRNAPLYVEGAGLQFASCALRDARLDIRFHLPLTRVSGSTSSFRMTVASGFVLVGGFVCLSVSATPISLVFAVTLFSLADMLVGPLIPTIVHALAPPQAKATYQAANSVTSDLKDSLGPATGTAIYAFGSRLPWLIGVPVTAVAALALAFQMKRHEKNPEA